MSSLMMWHDQMNDTCKKRAVKYRWSFSDTRLYVHASPANSVNGSLPCRSSTTGL